MMNEKAIPTTRNYPLAQKYSVAQPSAEKPLPPSDFIEFARQYARAKPEVVALWCLGIGFVVGWKLKPW